MDASPPPKKKRIPKACASCRASKLRCDGGKPCTRCRAQKVHCDYFVRPVVDDPLVLAEKVARLEAQMKMLVQASGSGDASTAMTLLQLQQQQVLSAPLVTAPSTSPPYPIDTIQTASPLSISESLPSQSQNGCYARRTPGDFEVNVEPPVDAITKGLVTYEEAALYFQTFFQGCDKYVPIFDPIYDTFDSIRRRSSILFDTILTIGCRAENGPVSSRYQMLSNTTKGPIAEILLGTIPSSIETVQALLVNASYSEKGWMLTSLAVKMVLDLNLPESYSQLCSLIIQPPVVRDIENEKMLFRETRLWFGTFVLEHILSLDCGKQPGINAKDERRCRVLLGHHARTSLDFRLLAQVELNSIRSHAHDRLSPKAGTTISDQELGDIVQGTRIDLGIWLSDWTGLVESAVMTADERETLIINLRIQRDWSEMTMLCKGLQAVGIDNVAIMSSKQRNLIHLAKLSAQRHMSTILSNPSLYLGTFRYGMDFVWAKCAFSVLLLLKLARLLPESSNMPQLIADSKVLLTELRKVRGLNNIYVRILALSVEKCERALREETVGDGAALSFPDAEMEFQNYVPKEFILEWSFPGLTFCWLPFDFQDLFMDFGSGP